MSRLPLVVVVVAACGGPSKPPPTVPLPEEPRQASSSPAAPAGDKASPEAEKPAARVAPPAPAGPAELKIPAAQTAVKMVSDGKGKKQPLRYTARPGTKQAVEVAMDFTAKQDTEGEVVPTIVLIGEAETKAIDPDGAIESTLTVSGTDVRAVTDATVPVDQMKIAIGSLTGLTIGGKHAANGTAGEVTIRIEHPPQGAAEMLLLIRELFPVLPVLPAQPLGVGAKWQSTTTRKLADKVDVTQVTDYELVGHDGTTWKIKGTTKISGKDQEVEGAKISAITGAGTSETSITDGALYPVHKSSLDAQFSVADGDKSAHFALRFGGAVTPK